MAPEESRRRSHRKHSSKSTRRIDETKRDEQPKADNLGSVRPQNIDDLRDARLAYLAQSPEERREKMKFIGETVVKTETTTRGEGRPRGPTTESKAPKPESKRKRSQSTRAHPESHPDSGDEYVYGRPEPVAEETERIAPSRAPTVKKAEPPKRSRTRRTSSNNVPRHAEERRTSARKEADPARRRNSFGIDERNTPDRYARDKSCCTVC